MIMDTAIYSFIEAGRTEGLPQMVKVALGGFQVHQCGIQNCIRWISSRPLSSWESINLLQAFDASFCFTKVKHLNILCLMPWEGHKILRTSSLGAELKDSGLDAMRQFVAATHNFGSQTNNYLDCTKAIMVQIKLLLCCFQSPWKGCDPFVTPPAEVLVPHIVDQGRCKDDHISAVGILE